MLRDATLDDVAFLGPIEAAGDARFAAAGHPELADGSTIPLDVARRSIAEERLIVAEVDGTVVAWAQFSRDPGEWCLGQISVLPEHQGTGIGTALLGEVIARAVTAGVRTLVLNTQDDVPWNRPWYEHAGFVVVPEAQWTATMRDDTAAQVAAGLDWSTRVHMRLTLAGTDRR